MAFDLDDQPACLVVDLRMPGRSGLELQQLLLERGLEMSIVFISGGADVESGVRAMKGGAITSWRSRSRTKRCSPPSRAALASDRSRRVVDAELQHLRSRLATLTPRERDVFGLIVTGLLNKQVGVWLGTRRRRSRCTARAYAEDGRGLTCRARAHVRQAAAAGRSLAGPGHGAPRTESERELAYAWYVALVLMACNTLSFIDRQILGLLVTPIKHELGLSDTQVGCCRGWRSALLHAARDADGPHRGPGIAADTRGRGHACWSLMTALCAAARSFGALFLAAWASRRRGDAVAVGLLAAVGLLPARTAGDGAQRLLDGHLLRLGAGADPGRPDRRRRGIVADHLPDRRPAGPADVARRAHDPRAASAGPAAHRGRGAGAAPPRTWRARYAEARLRRRHLLRLRRAGALQLRAAGLAADLLRQAARLLAAPGGRDAGPALARQGLLGAYAGGRLADRWQRLGVAEAPLRVGVLATSGAGSPSRSPSCCPRSGRSSPCSGRPSSFWRCRSVASMRRCS